MKNKILFGLAVIFAAVIGITYLYYSETVEYVSVNNVEDSKADETKYVSLKRDDGSVFTLEVTDSMLWPIHFEMRSRDVYNWLAGEVGTDNKFYIRYYGWRNGWFSMFPNFECLEDGDGSCITKW